MNEQQAIEHYNESRPSHRLARRFWHMRYMLLAGVIILCVGYSHSNLQPEHALTGAALLLAAVLLTPLSPAPAAARGERQNRVALGAHELDGRAAALIEALPGACILIDRRGLVVLRNQQARETIPDLKTGIAFVLSMRAPDVVEAVEEVLAGGEARDVPFEEKTPVERWLRAHVAPVRIGPGKTSGKPHYVAISLQDLSSQMRLERMRVDFVANASHELRTPLASLTGFIETLQGPAKNDLAARDKFLAIMHRQAWRMSRLVDDLLSLSRIEMHAHVRPKTVIDLRTIVAQTVDALAPVAAEAQAKVSIDSPDEPMLVRGERDELVRVAENLIENAIKYGDEGGEVRISLGRSPARPHENETVFLKVKDNGPGIAAEHLPRLTERFYRVSVSSSRERGGTGLGLALVKHIINRHRGRLEIISEPGKGSTFTARFEAAPPAST